MTNRDHGDPGDAPSTLPPLQPPVGSARPSAAEQARTIAAAGNAATLATLTTDGDPWASFVAYGLLGGQPVLCLSNLAEHGRNLAGDPRASLSIVAESGDSDPLAKSRITLAGLVSQPSAADRDAVRAAYASAVPAARMFLDFSDFTLWVLKVQRVRWVGGYGRMDSATGEQYDAAIRSRRLRPGPLRTSTPITPTPWWRWSGRLAAIPILTSLCALVSIATA
jgi:hypothetical protein